MTSKPTSGNGGMAGTTKTPANSDTGSLGPDHSASGGAAAAGEQPKAFDAQGAVGKAFTADGAIGGTAEAIGGPLSQDGAIGKHFTKDGSIGGTVQDKLGGSK